MFELITPLASAVRSGFNAVSALLPLGLKGIKYFIDSRFREKVTPVPGSVLYCDLWVAVEHSGIYVGEGRISNIVVDGVAQSTVMFDGPSGFTSKSTLGRKIYVSCDRHGSVGSERVGAGAASHVGEKGFYGLVIKNCHEFSTKCVSYANGEAASSDILARLTDIVLPESWEPTLRALKDTARDKLGASKWRLWDWDNDIRDNPPTEPEWQTIYEQLRHLPLDAEGISHIRAELAATREYQAEISDEAIPPAVRGKLSKFGQTLADIDCAYTEIETFLRQCPGACLSFADLQACKLDWQALARQMQQAPGIRGLIRKLGRNHISEEKKRQTRIPQVSRSEVHGTHRGADVQRMLPSELLYLEDEELEALFYARLLEENLLCYELSGTTLVNGNESETQRKRTGPVVACLDTSGSMEGMPALNAKALLLAIANILQQERRSLHVLLFGASGEIREFAMDECNDASGLLRFLLQGFGGGTDFEAPLRRAFEIIATQKSYLKADVLMVSDGDCELTEEFAAYVCTTKTQLDCSIYSVLCAGMRTQDNFSDETVVLQ